MWGRRGKTYSKTSIDVSYPRFRLASVRYGELEFWSKFYPETWATICAIEAVALHVRV